MSQVQFPQSLPDEGQNWNDPVCPVCNFGTEQASLNSMPCHAPKYGYEECGCDICIGATCNCNGDQILTYLKGE